LSGKVALVSGSSRGIGRAIALRLGELGADVVVNYSTAARRAEEVVGDLRTLGRQAVAAQADVSSAGGAAALVEATLELGGLHILVNNAGTRRDTLLVRMEEADWDEVMSVNLKSAFLLSKAAARLMIRQRYGRIINITSIAGITGNAGQANYASAKAGMIGFTKTIARELGPRNITVNAVAPGFIRTDLTADLPDEVLQRAQELTPLGRLGTPEDVAHAVAFLASDEAAFITGQVLRVDGGMIF
jgi:3-oxoacyl-[acyl-carrier protein] reductase